MISAYLVWVLSLEMFQIDQEQKEQEYGTIHRIANMESAYLIWFLRSEMRHMDQE
jgi:hypothetical protein